MGGVDTAALPNEVGALKNIIVDLNEQLLHEKSESAKIISILEEQVAFSKDMLYGPRSEKWSSTS